VPGADTAAFGCGFRRTPGDRPIANLTPKREKRPANLTHIRHMTEIELKFLVDRNIAEELWSRVV
jgi:hypothetical protein